MLYTELQAAALLIFKKWTSLRDKPADRFVLSLGLETTHFRTLIVHNASQSCTEHRPKSTEVYRSLPNELTIPLKPTDIC